MSDLQTLIDEAAIRKLHLRYCRGVDRMDWDLVRDCYHPDATDEHGAFSGGVEDFIGWLRAGLPRFERTMHFTGNQFVEVNGDSAWAEHYAQAFHRLPNADGQPARDLVINVRYVDRLERRAGEWRILRRTVIDEGQRAHPVGDPWMTARTAAATRDRGDPSYLLGPAA